MRASSMLGARMSETFQNFRRSNRTEGTREMQRCADSSSASISVIEIKADVKRQLEMIENPDVSAVDSMDYETSINREEARSSMVSAFGK